jgi:uncharacterized phage protein (TIGR01671 family)
MNGPFNWNRLPNFNNPDNFIIQQFTGLFDKNGKEIYEGDIVKLEGFKEYMEVKFGVWDDFTNMNGGNGFYYHGKEWGDWGFSRQEDIEVIGNIFENKDAI